MLRPLIFKRTLFNKYTNTPRLSYIANKTYPQLIWNNIIPYPLKITSVFTGGVLTFINFHPKYYITLGPPLGILGYLGYTKYRTFQYNKAVNKLGVSQWRDSELIRIAKYDESSIENVLEGIDNSYDSIRRQVMQLVEMRILEYIFKKGIDDVGMVMKAFVLENDQISINIPELEIESWITTNVQLPDINNHHLHHNHGEEGLVKFIKFSAPYYDSKSVETRKRLGVVLVYLLEIPNEDGEKTTYTDYKIGIEITSLSWFKPKSIYFSELDGSPIMESNVYSNNKQINK